MNSKKGLMITSRIMMPSKAYFLTCIFVVSIFARLSSCSVIPVEESVTTSNETTSDQQLNDLLSLKNADSSTEIFDLNVTTTTTTTVETTTSTTTTTTIPTTSTTSRSTNAAKSPSSSLGKRLQSMLNTQRIKPLFIPSLEVDDGAARFDNVIYRGKNLIRRLELNHDNTDANSKVFNMTMGSVKIRSNVYSTSGYNESFEGIIRGMTGKLILDYDEQIDSFRVRLTLNDMDLNERMVVKRLYLSSNLSSILKQMNQHSRLLLTDPISFYLREWIETLVNLDDVKEALKTNFPSSRQHH